MTSSSSLIVNNDVLNKFKMLSVESSAFPFHEDGVKYDNVLQYVFYHISPHRELLWEPNPRRLRILFNRLSNKDFINRTKHSIFQVISEAIRTNTDFRNSVKLLSNGGKKGLYYITNQTTLWGINEDGYGYNFVGLAYSKSLQPFYSSLYTISMETISLIFKCSRLLIVHFQNGHDIHQYIGKACPEYFQELANIYPQELSLIPTDERIWETYVRGDEEARWVHDEIDYPCNLAGFIRAEYIRYFNFYLRTRFHRLMITSYFKYVVRTKYAEHVVDADIDYHAKKLFKGMASEYRETLSNKLYYLYNDPGTTSKMDSFLDFDIRKELYEMEIQFKTQAETENIEAFIPFLYYAPKETSLFIYNTQEEFFELFEPYTTQLSPYTPHDFLKPRISFMQRIFVRLISQYSGVAEDKVFENAKINFVETSFQFFDQLLQQVTNTKKGYYVKRAYELMIAEHPILRFAIYNTNRFGDNVVVSDSDTVIQEKATSELLKIRGLLTEPYYPISLFISDDIEIQDRLRFRIQDFHRILQSYNKFIRESSSSSLLTYNDFTKFQDKIYQDPNPFFEKKGMLSTDPIDAFKNVFANVCDKEVQKKIWVFLQNYSRSYEQYREDLVSNQENASVKRNLHLIVANIFNTIQGGTNLERLVEILNFISDLLYIKERFNVPKLRNVGGSTVISAFNQNFNQLKQYIDFSKISADLGFALVEFATWLERQNIPIYRTIFLSSIHHGTYQKTPLTYSIHEALKPFIAELDKKNVKASSNKKISSKSKGKSKSKKTVVEELVSGNTDAIIGEEEEDDAVLGEEEMEDILEELGLNDSDDDEGEEDGDNDDDDIGADD
jgi:hypothetical protein